MYRLGQIREKREDYVHFTAVWAFGCIHYREQILAAIKSIGDQVFGGRRRLLPKLCLDTRSAAATQISCCRLG